MKTITVILIIITALITGFLQSYYRSEYIIKAYDSYFQQNFQETLDHLSYLEDSLDFKDQGITLNKAHALYRLHNFDGRINPADTEDSVYLDKIQMSMNYYTQGFELDNQLASISYNQSGNLIFKTGVINRQKVGLDQLLSTSIEYYKNALMADPGNVDARYNYELLKKYKEFPDQLFKIVEHLVAQRQYKTAYQILAPWAQKDQRFDNKKDYAKRLGEIVQIETKVEEQK